MVNGFRKVLTSSLIAFACMISMGESCSSLWGSEGEQWDPAGRLPDFSYAGYQHGEKPIPSVPVALNVKDFGAVGDGLHDDTAAFRDALESCTGGAVLVPPGRYRITDILEINKPGVVLRGSGPERSILYFPIPLNDIRPDWGATTGGRRTSNYSWSGGFLRIAGDYQSAPLTTVTVQARRGDTILQVASAEMLAVGQQLEILVQGSSGGSLADYLYSGDPGDVGKLKTVQASMVATVVGISNNTIELDRRLRFDLRPEWEPKIQKFEPTVTECGIEDLGFEFPLQPYAGHFTELGHNAIAFSHVAHCWVRNVRILNSDSGLFISSRFCTVTGVTYESDRSPDDRGRTGHHGIYFHGLENLFTDFRFNQRFIHDISVGSRCLGNVIAGGSGVDLCLDHHKQAPYENLFTDLDAGEGSRLWLCGGGAQLGKHCGARGTFWNIRARNPIPYPPEVFGPASMNIVGLSSDQPAITEPDGKWFEPLGSNGIVPANLYQAQLKRRLAFGSGKSHWP